MVSAITHLRQRSGRRLCRRKRQASNDADKLLVHDNCLHRQPNTALQADRLDHGVFSNWKQVEGFPVLSNSFSSSPRLNAGCSAAKNVLVRIKQFPFCICSRHVTTEFARPMTEWL